MRFASKKLELLAPAARRPRQFTLTAASMAIISPSGLAIVSRCSPIATPVGNVIRSVFMSTNVVGANFMPTVAAVPDVKPLPRMVSVAPLPAEALTGEMPRGT